MLTISDNATEFIIKEENSDEGYYNKLCRGFEWPGGASGPTVGIGYDCGYCNRKEIDEDWQGLIPQKMIEVLLAACGRTHDNAHQWVRTHRHDVDIPWDVACTQFAQREVPKWVGRVTAVLPNCEALHPTSFGAIVSLAYNRGASFRAGGDRNSEMRAIHDHMVNGNFKEIPEEFEKMRRLWPAGSQNNTRRHREAVLFWAGLKAPAELVSAG